MLTSRHRCFFGRVCPRSGWLLFGVIAAVLAVAVGAVPLRPVAAERSDFSPGELLVGLRSGGTVLRLRFRSDVLLGEVLAEYRARPDVAFAELNYRVHATAFPSDPDFSKQWYLAAIQARDAWSAELLHAESHQVKTPVIAVLDTGVDLDQPELRTKIWTNRDERPGDRIDNDRNGYVDDWQGWDFIASTPDPNPKFDDGFTQEAIHHGTIVAGVAAADSHNGIGVTGVSWKAKVMPLRVLDSAGNGTIYDVLRAVEYAANKKADVINLSFVGVEFSQALYTGLKAAAAQGVVIVAAAGNASDGVFATDLSKTPAYPICLDADDPENFIVGVAALNQQRQLSRFSNYGKGCVDLSAPGQDFYGVMVQESGRSGFLQTAGGNWSGTSVATPVVAGAAAIVRSLRPELTAGEVREILGNSVDDITIANPRFPGHVGNGQVNLLKVVNQAVAYRSVSGPRVESGGMVAVGLGFGSFPQVKLYTPELQALKSFFAYAPTFSGSISLAGGDVVGDAEPEIVSGTGTGGGPHVRIFNREGQVQGQFFAADARTRQGVNVAVGNLDGRGSAEIITAPAGGALPQVTVYDGRGNKLSSWLAYSQGYRGAVAVAAGDIDGDGTDEVITGTGPGGGPQVRIFAADGKLRAQWFAFNAVSRLGVNVAAGDIDGDGTDEIIASIPRSGLPLVRIFSANRPEPIAEFFAFAPNFTGGIALASGDLDGDGRAEIITGAGPGGGPHVRIFGTSGVLKGEFFAHDASYRGGARPAFLPPAAVRR